ncbi:MAG: adenylate/guanylate cyclase domain-containing protein [Actinomycetota bacterium]
MPAEAVLRVHRRDLRRIAIACGGQEVKSLGDGLMVVYRAAIDGVGCAIAMQQSFAPQAADEALPAELRIGLHAGEAILDEDDYFGMPVVLARRMCDRAAEGHIVVSDLVRSLIGTPGSFRFAQLGSFEPRRSGGHLGGPVGRGPRAAVPVPGGGD